MEFLSDFGVEPILLLAQIINFVILLFILQRFLYKPLLKVLEERKKKIETSMRQSDEIQKKFDEVGEKQQEILDKAKSESSSIIENAKKEAKALSDQIQTGASLQAEETMKRTKEALELEREKMVAEARKQLGVVVATAAEKIIEKSLSNSDKERFVAAAVKEIENEKK